MPKKNIEIDEKDIISDREKGLTYTQLQQKHRIGTKRISDILKKFGIRVERNSKKEPVSTSNDIGDPPPTLPEGKRKCSAVGCKNEIKWRKSYFYCQKCYYKIFSRGRADLIPHANC